MATESTILNLEELCFYVTNFQQRILDRVDKLDIIVFDDKIWSHFIRKACEHIETNLAFYNQAYELMLETLNKFEVIERNYLIIFQQTHLLCCLRNIIESEIDYFSTGIGKTIRNIDEITNVNSKLNKTSSLLEVHKRLIASNDLKYLLYHESKYVDTRNNPRSSVSDICSCLSISGIEMLYEQFKGEIQNMTSINEDIFDPSDFLKKVKQSIKDSNSILADFNARIKRNPSFSQTTFAKTNTLLRFKICDNRKVTVFSKDEIIDIDCQLAKCLYRSSLSLSKKRSIESVSTNESSCKKKVVLATTNATSTDTILDNIFQNAGSSKKENNKNKKVVTFDSDETITTSVKQIAEGIDKKVKSSISNVTKNKNTPSNKVLIDENNMSSGSSAKKVRRSPKKGVIGSAKTELKAMELLETIDEIDKTPPRKELVKTNPLVTVEKKADEEEAELYFLEDVNDHTNKATNCSVEVQNEDNINKKFINPNYDHMAISNNNEENDYDYVDDDDDEDYQDIELKIVVEKKSVTDINLAKKKKKRALKTVDTSKDSQILSAPSDLKNNFKENYDLIYKNNKKVSELALFNPNEDGENIDMTDWLVVQTLNICNYMGEAKILLMKAYNSTDMIVFTIWANFFDPKLALKEGFFEHINNIAIYVRDLLITKADTYDGGDVATNNVRNMGRNIRRRQSKIVKICLDYLAGTLKVTLPENFFIISSLIKYTLDLIAANNTSDGITAKELLSCFQKSITGSISANPSGLIVTKHESKLRNLKCEDEITANDPTINTSLMKSIKTPASAENFNISSEENNIALGFAWDNQTKLAKDLIERACASNDLSSLKKILKEHGLFAILIKPPSNKAKENKIHRACFGEVKQLIQYFILQNGLDEKSIHDMFYNISNTDSSYIDPAKCEISEEFRKRICKCMEAHKEEDISVQIQEKLGFEVGESVEYRLDDTTWESCLIEEVTKEENKYDIIKIRNTSGIFSFATSNNLRRPSLIIIGETFSLLRQSLKQFLSEEFFSLLGDVSVTYFGSNSTKSLIQIIKDSENYEHDNLHEIYPYIVAVLIHMTKVIICNNGENPEFAPKIQLLQMISDYRPGVISIFEENHSISNRFDDFSVLLFSTNNLPDQKNFRKNSNLFNLSTDDIFDDCFDIYITTKLSFFKLNDPTGECYTKKKEVRRNTYESLVNNVAIEIMYKLNPDRVVPHNRTMYIDSSRSLKEIIIDKLSSPVSSVKLVKSEEDSQEDKMEVDADDTLSLNHSENNNLYQNMNSSRYGDSPQIGSNNNNNNSNSDENNFSEDKYDYKLLCTMFNGKTIIVTINSKDFNVSRKLITVIQSNDLSNGTFDQTFKSLQNEINYFLNVRDNGTPYELTYSGNKNFQDNCALLWNLLATNVANREYQSGAMIYKPFLSFDCLFSLFSLCNPENNSEIHSGIYNIFAAFINLEANNSKSNVVCSNILPDRCVRSDIYQQLLIRLDKPTIVFIKPTKHNSHYAITIFIKSDNNLKCFYIDPTDNDDWITNAKTEIVEVVNWFMPSLFQEGQMLEGNNMILTHIVIPRNDNPGKSNSGILVLLYMLSISAFIVNDNKFNQFISNFGGENVGENVAHGCTLDANSFTKELLGTGSLEKIPELLLYFLAAGKLPEISP